MINRRRADEKRYRQFRKTKPQTDRCDFCAFTPDDTQVRAEGKALWVANNLFPYSIWDGHEVEDHAMVIPKRHVEGIHELTEAEQCELIQTIASYEARGYSVYARAPINQQKTVPHQHTHLIKLCGKPKRLHIASKKPYILWVR